MNKRVLNGLFVLIIITLVSGVVIAANATTNTSTTTNSNVNAQALQDEGAKINQAYSCLSSKTNNRTLSLQEAVFSTLALGSNDNSNKKIDSEKSSASCWPKAGCTLKDTSQVLLSYNRIGKSTGDIENWLLSKNASISDLAWYLEIDISNHISSECTVSYDSVAKKVNIGDDMKVQVESGGCLSASPNGYWLSISPACNSKQFSISCKEDFVTTLLYSKKGGNTVYVSSSTHSQAALGTTTEQINAQCFKTGTGNCDYEGSLWSTLALQTTGHDIAPYTPYLLAMADDNSQYFPSSFLYILVGGDDNYGNVIQSQKKNQYWSVVGSPYSTFYDTSLGMLALYGTSANEFDNGKTYLLNVQGRDGCWNNGNVRDTAFILYSAWPKEVGAISSGGNTNSSGGQLNCQISGSPRSCEKSISVCTSGGGSIQSQYSCPNWGEFCCSINVHQQTCTEKNGKVCASNQKCTDNPVQSADGSCCLTTCQNIVSEDTCSIAGGVCTSDSSCGQGEDQISEACADSTQICCRVSSGPTPTPGKSTAWLWILIILILIILIVLAIIFRDKLKIWWFKFNGKAKSSSFKRPGFPPSSGPSQGFTARPLFKHGFFSRNPVTQTQRPSPPISRTLPPARRVTEKDKEMEETLKKLREMSK